MTGGDLLAAEADGELIKGGELQTAVTSDAGNWGLAVEIAINEGLHHVALEFLFQIQNIERKP